MPSEIQVKRRGGIAVAVVVLLSVASLLIWRYNSHRTARTFTFPIGVSATNITWIDDDSFVSLTHSISGRSIWNLNNIQTGKSKPIADLAGQPQNSLLWRMAYSKCVISPDGKFIAGHLSGIRPWVSSTAALLTPSPPGKKTAPPKYWSQKAFCEHVRWTIDDQSWIVVSRKNDVEVYNRSGRQISRFALPEPLSNFAILLGETADGKFLLQPLSSWGRPGSTDTLTSIDPHTGKSASVVLERPAGVRSNMGVLIELSPQGTKLAWLNGVTPRDRTPRWLHKILLITGIDTTPKSQCVIEVGGLNGQNTHVVAAIDETNTSVGDFGWLPGGNAIYINSFTPAGANIKSSAITERIVVIPAD